MTAHEQTVVSLFRVTQNYSDLFSLTANSGAPHARGAQILTKYGNLSIQEVLVATSACARRPSAVNRCQKSHFNTSYKSKAYTTVFIGHPCYGPVTAIKKGIQ